MSHPSVDRHRVPVQLALLRLTVSAALLLLPGAQAQLVSNQPPPGFASPQEVKRLNDQINNLKALLDAAQKAQQVAAKRAELAEAAIRGSNSNEQSEGIKRERDTARSELQAARDELTALKQALATAQAEARRALRSDPAVAAERDRLRQQVLKLQEELATARCAAAPVATTQPSAVTAAASSPLSSASGLAASSAWAGAPADLSDIAVPACTAFPAFVLLPATGPLTLGSGTEAIRARISHRIAMGRTEVTVGQWRVFWSAPDRDYLPVKTENTQCNWDDRDVSSLDVLPVACVNVADVEAYIRWFNRRYAAVLATALGVSVQRLQIGLPTDLEWEIAARGDRLTQEYLWHNDASDSEKCRHAQLRPCRGNLLPVGSREANAFKLHDMIGNVWEWTASSNRNRLSISGDGGEVFMEAPKVRGVRGGSSATPADSPSLRFASGGGYDSDLRNALLGFRLIVRVAP